MVAITMTSIKEKPSILSEKVQIQNSIKAIKGYSRTLNDAFKSLPNSEKKELQKVNHKKLYKTYLQEKSGNSFVDKNLFESIITGNNSEKNMPRAAQKFISNNAATISSMFSEMNNLNNLDVDRIKTPKTAFLLGAVATILITAVGFTQSGMFSQTETTKNDKKLPETNNPAPVISNDSTNSNASTGDFKEIKPAKPSLDSLGAGDPPLKIGNITIDENDIATSLTSELGIYDMTARRFASNIQAIRNSEYKEQYTKVIKVIDGFVASKKISDKQGWALLLKITNGKMFNQSFEPNSDMGTLFTDATNSDKGIKAFYDAGNLTSTGGTFNPQAFGQLLAYAANTKEIEEEVSDTKSTPKKKIEIKEDNTGTDYSKYAKYGNAYNNSAVEQSEKDLESSKRIAGSIGIDTTQVK